MRTEVPRFLLIKFSRGRVWILSGYDLDDRDVIKIWANGGHGVGLGMMDGVMSIEREHGEHNSVD
tara:strand:+ start:846 stop:1040 length:195 start_codon:yes stop_codon:yes gene_type:complete